MWELWPFCPVNDEVYGVVFVDGIQLQRNAVSLSAQSRNTVLGWYLTRSEKSRAWETLMSRIAPTELVVADRDRGFAKACTRSWPTTRIQRCTFQAFGQIKQAAAIRSQVAPPQR